jgi:hypothetical protein
MLLLAACSTPPPASRPAAARLFLECRPGESGEMVQLPVSGVTIAIGGKPVFFESDLIGADVAETDFGRCLRLRLAPAAAADLARLSLAAPGRRLVLNVDGRWIGARRVDRPLLDGSLYVFVEVADDRLPELARSLRPAGQRVASAPVPEGRRW